MLVAQMIVFV